MSAGTDYSRFLDQWGDDRINVDPVEAFEAPAQPLAVAVTVTAEAVEVATAEAE